MEKEQAKALVRAITGSDVVNKEKLIEIGKKLWEFRKFLARNPELRRSELNEEQKRFVEMVRTALGIRTPIGTGGLAGIFGENRLEYALGNALTSYACSMFEITGYEEGLDKIIKDMVTFQYHDSMDETPVISAYLKLGKPRKARGVVETFERLGKFGLYRAFDSYAVYFKDLKSAFEVLKKIEKYIDKEPIDSFGVMMRAVTLYENGLKTEEVRKKIVEYAQKVINNKKVTAKGFVPRAKEMLEKYARGKIKGKR